jgi:hypothetical protein
MIVLNFVNCKTGEIRQVSYLGDNKYESLFKALRRKNVQDMIKEADVLKEDEIIIGDLIIEIKK